MSGFQPMVNLTMSERPKTERSVQPLVSAKQDSTEGNNEGSNGNDDDEENAEGQDTGGTRPRRTTKSSTNQLKEIFDGVSMPTRRKTSVDVMQNVEKRESIQTKGRAIAGLAGGEDVVFADVWQKDVAQAMDGLKAEQESRATDLGLTDPAPSQSSSTPSQDGKKSLGSFKFRLPNMGFNSPSSSKEKFATAPITVRTPPIYRAAASSPSSDVESGSEGFLSRFIGNRSLFERPGSIKKNPSSPSLGTVRKESDGSEGGSQQKQTSTGIGGESVASKDSLLEQDEAKKTALKHGGGEEETEQEMEREWLEILEREEEIRKNWSDHSAMQIRKRVKKGVPRSLRGRIWIFLTQCSLISSGSQSNAKARPANKTHRRVPSESVYMRAAPPGTYKNLLTHSSPYEAEIKRDVARTFPTHPKFSNRDGPGQTALFNIMKVYSLYDKDLGYCQGLAFIVGVLLMHMEEEEAFTTLTYMMNVLNLRELFLPVMEPLLVCLYQLSRIVYDRYPKLHGHLSEFGIRASMYASQWFLTLFASQFHLPLVFRVMDIMMVEGSTFLLRMSLALLQTHQDDILKHRDFEDVLAYLKYGLPNAHTHAGTGDNSANINAQNYANEMRKRSESIGSKMDAIISSETRKLEDSISTAELEAKNLSSFNGDNPLDGTEGLPAPASHSSINDNPCIKKNREKYKSISNDNTAEDVPHPSVRVLIDLALQMKISDNMLEMLATEYIFMKDRAESDERERLLRKKLQESLERIQSLERDQNDMKRELLTAYEGFNAVQKETAESMVQQHEMTVSELRDDYEVKLKELRQVLEAAEQRKQDAINELRSEHASELEHLQTEHRSSVDSIGAQCKEIVERVGRQCKDLIDDTLKDHRRQLDDIKRKMEEREAQHQADLEETERKYQQQREEQEKLHAILLEKYISEHNEELEEQKRQVASLKESLRHLTDGNHIGLQNLEKLHRAEIEALQQKLRQLEDDKKAAMEVGSKHQQQLISTMNSQVELSKQLDAQRRENRELGAALQKQQTMVVANLESEVETLKKDKANLQTTVSRMEKQLLLLEDELVRAKLRLSAYE
eukprot:comp23130_c0_seq1/m.37300 comp23130_c0_seq1/g.37300  ORF comp23130_c0_seq1/g.37300 comp23130_c0_seq1/m.37300 type:complete len:1074 (-) comp23130_c0_seq1:402-3623(-)